MHTNEYGYFSMADVGSVQPGNTIAPFIPVTGGGRGGATMEGGGAIEDTGSGGRSGGSKQNGDSQVKDDGGRPGASRGEEIIFTEDQGPLDTDLEKKEEKGSSTMLYVGIGIFVVVLIIVVVILMRRRKQKQVTKK